MSEGILATVYTFWGLGAVTILALRFSGIIRWPWWIATAPFWLAMIVCTLFELFS